MKQEEVVTNRNRIVGALVAVSFVVPGAACVVAYGGSLALYSSGTYRDLQGIAAVVGIVGVPIVCMLIAALFNRWLGAWYSRSKYSQYLVPAAWGGFGAYLVLILKVISNRNSCDAFVAAAKGLFG